jgi:hypothetical protein
LRTFIGDFDQVLNGSTPRKISSFGVNGLQAEWGYDILSLLGLVSAMQQFTAISVSMMKPPFRIQSIEGVLTTVFQE